MCPESTYPKDYAFDLELEYAIPMGIQLEVKTHPKVLIMMRKKGDSDDDNEGWPRSWRRWSVQLQAHSFLYQRWLLTHLPKLKTLQKVDWFLPRYSLRA